MYRNEKACGQAIKNSDIDRSELFFTTKVPPGSMGYDRTKRQVDVSVRETGLEYIDLLVSRLRLFCGACQKTNDR